MKFLLAKTSLYIWIFTSGRILNLTNSRKFGNFTLSLTFFHPVTAQKFFPSSYTDPNPVPRHRVFLFFLFLLNSDWPRRRYLQHLRPVPTYSFLIRLSCCSIFLFLCWIRHPGPNHNHNRNFTVYLQKVASQSQIGWCGLYSGLGPPFWPSTALQRLPFDLSVVVYLVSDGVDEDRNL